MWETPIYKTETEAKSVCENEVLNNCKCSKGSIFAFEGPCPSKVISKMCTGPQTCLGGYVYDYGEWSYWSTMWCVPSSTLNCQLRTNYY